MEGPGLLQWVAMLWGEHRAQGLQSPLSELPLAARTQQLSPWDQHECRQHPGVTAGAIRSWQAAGKQDDERVTGRGSVAFHRALLLLQEQRR